MLTGIQGLVTHVELGDVGTRAKRLASSSQNDDAHRGITVGSAHRRGQLLRHHLRKSVESGGLVERDRQYAVPRFGQDLAAVWHGFLATLVVWLALVDERVHAFV